MKKEGKVLCAFLLILLASASLSIASLQYKSNALETTYSAGERIRGTVNISISDEPADSLFKSNFNGSIKLIDLLQKNNFVEGTDYRCSYTGCFDSYEGSSTATSINLDEDSPAYFGFKITGENVEVDSINFSISSNAGVSCNRQFILDVLDRNESFIQNSESSEDVCTEGEHTGCFNPGLGSYESVIITTNPYCEKITLDAAPSYKLGAQVEKGTGDTTLIMELSNTNGDNLAECDLPEQTQPSQSLSCIVNYSIINNGNYLVCIRASDDGADQKMRIEQVSPVCGTDSKGLDYSLDYEIFAQPRKFAAPRNMSVDSETFAQQNPESSDLVNYVTSYLLERYSSTDDGRINCSKGCIIPFRIEGVSQRIAFSNVAVVYKRGGSKLYSNNVYLLNKQKSKITTPKTINIDVSKADITIPFGTANNTKLYLYLNDKAILPVPLTLKIMPSFSFDIYPKRVLLGAKTNFKTINSSRITSSAWDFGDGSSGTSTGNSISHRYTTLPENGIYSVGVELTRSDGIRARNVFDVSLGSLSESANALVADYRIRLQNLTAQINSFTPFVASSLKTKFNLTEMNASVAAAQSTLASAAGDEQYLSIIQQLLAANIPSSVVLSKEGTNIPFSVGFANMNLQMAEEISDATLSVSDEETLKQTIAGWFDKNYAATISFQVYSGDYDGSVSPIMTKIRLDISKNANADSSAYEAYLFINYPIESIKFAGNYSEKNPGSGTYLPVSGPTTIEFAIYSDVQVQELGMYISPKIENLEGFQSYEVISAGGFNWSRFIFWMVILLVLAFAVYIALQEWYKRRYEAYLFKSSNDLYNIINFVYNSRKNNLDDGEISRKLKGAGWSGEQVTYAIRKLDGKRTGMWEIPIFRIFEKRKIEAEIEKRKGSSQQPQQTKPLLK